MTDLSYIREVCEDYGFTLHKDYIGRNRKRYSFVIEASYEEKKTFLEDFYYMLDRPKKYIVDDWETVVMPKILIGLAFTSHIDSMGRNDLYVLDEDTIIDNDEEEEEEDEE